MEIRKLNTLRTLAALIVLISHYSNTSGIWNAMLGLGAGQFGVMLFFILSGFLMSYLYLGEGYDRDKARKYYIARLARVAPLFLLVVLMSFLSHLTGVFTNLAFDIRNPYELISHFLLLTGGNSVLWTIPVEMHFYLFFGVLWWGTSRVRFPLIIICASIAFIVAMLGFPDFAWKQWGLIFDIRSIKTLPYFITGVALGWLYRNNYNLNAVKSNWFMVTLLVVFLMYPEIYYNMTGARNPLQDEFGVWYAWKDMSIYCTMSITFFVFVFLTPDNWLTVNRIGDFLGKISYSMYLLHMPVLMFLKPYLKINPFGFLFVFLLLTTAISVISYHIIEAPLRRMIRTI